MNLITEPDNIDTKVLQSPNPEGFKMSGQIYQYLLDFVTLANEFYESNKKYYPSWLDEILKNLDSELI